MPRYHFSWGNLPPGLLRQLGAALDLRPPVDESLRSVYGARPGAEFVRDTWPLLIDAWLARDRASREWVVEALLARRLGNPDLPVRSPAGQLEYLRSCPGSAVLSEVVAAVFTAFGDCEPVSGPVPSATTAQDNPIVTPHRAGERPGEAGQPPRSIHDWLCWAVTEILGDGEVTRDPDGDIPVRHGSTMCFVRSIDDPPSVRLFAPMVVEVPRSPALLEALNTINMKITVGRVFHTPADEVIFALELYGEQLTVDIVRASLAAATSIADHFDHEIQSRFGGKTQFAEMRDDSVLV
jgi:T3SS (YopN, CesT) and YbjN peptide-binding chaperone 1